MFEVKKARRQRRPLKISLEGLSGSGKTYSALRLAFAMKRAGIGSKIVVADSENESAGLYDGVSIDGEVWQYEVCAIPHEMRHPTGYTECYEYLVGQGFDIVIFDSLSHAWHGAMEQVDAHARANRGDKFGGWANVTPAQRKMLDTLTDPRAHLVTTMRVKSEYERTEGENGRAGKIKKVGMKTDQRENTEYEFDCVVRLDPENHFAKVEKVRGCTAMDGKTGDHPGPKFWQPLFDWWLSAEAVVAPAEQLATAYASRIAAATTLDALKALMGSVNGDAKAGLLGSEQIARLGALKDVQKAKLAPAAAQSAPEGEHGSDPTPTTASVPSAATASPPAPAAKTTDAPKPPPAANDPIMGLLALMHELGVSWPEIRDRAEGKGAEIAKAAGIGAHKGEPVTALTLVEKNKLRTELDVRVAEKKQRAAQRAANKAQREKELAAEENAGAAS